jgi:inosose dehydratase
VHLKDVTLSVFDEIVRNGESSAAIWANEAFPRLGEGDFDVTRFVTELISGGFEGWLVVEQDIFPTSAARFAQAVEDQRLNRSYLTTLGI